MAGKIGICKIMRACVVAAFAAANAEFKQVLAAAIPSTTGWVC